MRGFHIFTALNGDGTPGRAEQHVYLTPPRTAACETINKYRNHQPEFGRPDSGSEAVSQVASMGARSGAGDLDERPNPPTPRQASLQDPSERCSARVRPHEATHPRDPAREMLGHQVARQPTWEGHSSSPSPPSALAPGVAVAPEWVAPTGLPPPPPLVVARRRQ